MVANLYVLVGAALLGTTLASAARVVASVPAAPICTPTPSPKPIAGAHCAVQGVVSGLGLIADFPSCTGNYVGCYETCATDATCRSFSYEPSSNTCQTFSKSVTGQNFHSSSSGVYFYNIRLCFKPATCTDSCPTPTKCPAPKTVSVTSTTTTTKIAGGTTSTTTQTTTTTISQAAITTTTTETDINTTTISLAGSTVTTTETDLGTTTTTETDLSTTTTTETDTTTTTTTQVSTTTVTETQTPTPTQVSCNNQGLQWAVYPNNQGSNPGGSYPGFNPTVYKTQTPSFYNVTTTIGGINIGSAATQISIYNSTYTFNSNFFVLNHRGYLFAPQTGQYTITLTNSDDLTMVWVGSNAYSGWTRSNDNMDQGCCSNSNSYPFAGVAGNYYPIRIVFAQAQAAAVFQLSVTRPDGTTLLNSSSAGSPYIVQYSCDGTSAPPFAPFGSET